MNSNHAKRAVGSDQKAVVLPLMNLEFIKLAKAMRAAQGEAVRSQRSARRARSLEQVFDAKIERYEREIAEVLKGLEKR